MNPCHEQPTDASSAEFLEMIDTLAVLLREQLRHGRRVAGLLRDRVEAEDRGDISAFERCLTVGRDALLDHTLAERERIAWLTQIGENLGHRDPSRLRLAELILYLPPEQRDELLDLREDFRDLADDLDSLHASSATLERHRIGQVTLYVTPGWSPPSERCIDTADAIEDDPYSDTRSQSTESFPEFF